MIGSMRTLATMLLILMPFASAVPQNELLAEEQDAPRYTVEIIIFRYAQEVSTGSETFPADVKAPAAPLFDEPPSDMATSGEVESAGEELPRVLRDTEYVVLAQDQYSMNDIMRRLDLLDVYDPMMHFGWTQTTWPEEQTQAIDLAAFARVPEGLDGQLTLYLSRYLHLVVDLQLDAPDTPGSNPALDASQATFGDDRLRGDLGQFGEPVPIRYHINENRILRSGELRYFDHPKFGVLAKVSRVADKPRDGRPSDNSADRPTG